MRSAAPPRSSGARHGRCSPIGNAEPVPIAAIPVLDIDAFRRRCWRPIADGWRLLLLGGAAGRRWRRPGCWRRWRTTRQGGIGLCAADVDGALSGAHPRLPRRRITSSAKSTSNGGVRPEGHPWLKPVRFPRGGRPIEDAEFFQGSRRRGPRGRGRPGACRGHRAGAFPLQLPRRARPPSRNLAGLSASRHRARRCAAARTRRSIHLAETRRRRHQRRSRDRLLPAASRRFRRRVLAAGASRCARSRWNWSGSPITSATWARLPAMSASCRPPPIAAGCAATC